MGARAVTGNLLLLLRSLSYTQGLSLFFFMSFCSRYLCFESSREWPLFQSVYNSQFIRPVNPKIYPCIIRKSICNNWLSLSKVSSEYNSSLVSSLSYFVSRRNEKRLWEWKGMTICLFQVVLVVLPTNYHNNAVVVFCLRDYIRKSWLLGRLVWAFMVLTHLALLSLKPRGQQLTKLERNKIINICPSSSAVTNINSWLAKSALSNVVSLASNDKLRKVTNNALYYSRAKGTTYTYLPVYLKLASELQQEPDRPFRNSRAWQTLSQF